METLRRLSIPLLLVAFALVFVTGCEDDNPVNIEDDPNPDRTIGNTLSGEVSGTLSGNYTLTDSAWVPANTTLRINPGTTIYGQSGSSLNVFGKIEASGTENDWITFTSARTFPDRGDWNGLRIIDSTDPSLLEYVQVSFAARYDLRTDTTRNRDNEIVIPETLFNRGAITIRNSSPTIRRCIIDFGGYDGIQIVGDSEALIEHNTIVNNAFNAIRVEPDWSKPFEQIFVEIGSSTIRNNILVENDDAGIRLHEDETFYALGIPTIEYNNIWNNASLDYVPPSFRNEADVSTDIHVNPVFVSVEEGDYTLHPCSGVVDRGTPTITDDDGTRLDIGALPLYQDRFDLAKNLVDNIYINNNPGQPGTLALQAGQVYYVRCDAYVPEGSTLRIPAGTTLAFEGPYSFYVRGELQAGDAGGSAVLFTSAMEEPQRGDWRQLVLDHAANTSYLRNVVVEYAAMDNRSTADPDTLGAVSVIASNLEISNMTIRDCYYAGLHLFDGANPTVDRLQIDGVGMHGVVCELNSSPTMTRVMIRNALGYGYYLVDNSSPTITNTLVYNVNTTGILVEDLSSPTISYATIYGQYEAIVGSEEPVTLQMSLGMRANRFARPVLRNSIVSEYSDAGVFSQVSSRPSLANVVLYNTVGADMTEGNVDTANLLDGDPQFVDPASGNFELQSGSPALTAGDDGGQVGAFGGNGM